MSVVDFSRGRQSPVRRQRGVDVLVRVPLHPTLGAVQPGQRLRQKRRRLRRVVVGKLGEPDGAVPGGGLDLGDVALELVEVGAVPVAGDEVDVATLTAGEEGLEEADAGGVGLFGAGDGGGAELDLAGVGFHPLAPRRDDATHVGDAVGLQHLRAARGLGLLGFVEAEDVGAARGDVGVDRVLPGTGEVGSVAFEHGDELHALRKSAAGGLGPVVGPAHHVGVELVGQTDGVVGETAGFAAGAGRGWGGRGGRRRAT